MTELEYNQLKADRPELMLPALEIGTHYNRLISVMTCEELITEVTSQILYQDDHPAYHWSMLPIWIKYFGKDELAPWSKQGSLGVDLAL